MNAAHRDALWQRLAPHVRTVARRNRRRRALVRISAGVALVAGATALVVTGHRAPASQALPLALTPRAALRVGVASVDLERGAARAVAKDQVFLEQGRLRVSAHGEFSVETPEASVKVLGTEFSVARDEGHTLVEVQKGRVQVQPKPGLGPRRVLLPGQRTAVPGPVEPRASASDLDRDAPISAPTADPPTSPQVMERAATRPERSIAVPEAVPRPPPTPPPPAKSPDLVAKADRARLRGDTRQAVEMYLAAARASDGLRAENALVEAARLLAGPLRDPLRAATIWREALVRFPTGAHREQALLGLALALEQAGQAAEARQAAQRLVAERPGTPGAREVERLLGRPRPR